LLALKAIDMAVSCSLEEETLLMFSLALAWLFDKLQNKQSLKMTKFAFMWGTSAPSCGEKPT
jgi:hypothetical protein